MKGWEEEIAPGSGEITTAVTKGRKAGITKFGPDNLPAGPGLTKSDEIIIVEGRADVLNLMKCGINHAIAVEGTHVPKTIKDLTKKSKRKRVIAFLDGDRGGDLILRELMQVARVDFIARAPEGKEVEELTRREVTKALQTQIPADQALALVSDRKAPTAKKRPAKKPKREVRPRRTEAPIAQKRSQEPSYRTRRREPRITKEDVDETYIEKINEVKEAFKAVVFDSDKKVIVECGVAELAKTLEELETADTIVFDGVVTQRLVDIASAKKARLLIGAAVADLEKKPSSLGIVTFDDLGV